MQLADKLVDGLEAAHEESRQREDVEERGEDQLPAPIAEAMKDAAEELRNQLLGAVRMILDGQHLNVAMLKIAERERLALEALQVAVSGKSSDIGQFVYASDRRDILERALGVLQPDLLHASAAIEGALSAQFSDLGTRVADLRESLSDLEDAQDELLDGEQKAAQAKGDGEGDKGDKPKPPSDPDAPRPPSSLNAGGPEAVPVDAPSTLSKGEPEAVLEDAPSTLSKGGPEAVLEDAKTTLIGPELPAKPLAPTTLGDAAEIEQAATPWWRRVLGE